MSKLEFSEQEKRKAEEATTRLFLETDALPATRYKTIAIDLQCRLSRAEELLSRGVSIMRQTPTSGLYWCDEADEFTQRLRAERGEEFSKRSAAML